MKEKDQRGKRRCKTHAQLAAVTPRETPEAGSTHPSAPGRSGLSPALGSGASSSSEEPALEDSSSLSARQKALGLHTHTYSHTLIHSHTHTHFHTHTHTFTHTLTDTLTQTHSHTHTLLLPAWGLQHASLSQHKRVCILTWQG